MASSIASRDPATAARRALIVGELRAAWASALLIMPQAVALATLAGLPPEAGLYASIFPVLVASLIGTHPLLLSGPNTAICVMIAAGLTPLAAPASPDYVDLALALSLAVGAIQLSFAFARLGRLILLVPEPVVHGITIGVGLVIVTGQSAAVLGVLAVPGESPWLAVWRFPAAVAHLNVAATLVAATAIATGMIAKYRFRSQRIAPVLVALVSGTIVALVLDAAVGPVATDLERVGTIVLTPFPLTWPSLGIEDLYVVKPLVVSALAIAFVGALQTTIILRNSDGPEAALRPDREIAVQGVANLVAAFTAGFAGSGSFNRSLAHAQAGARTRWSGVLSAVFVGAVGLTAAPLVARVPVAALAGTLVFVGCELVAGGWRRTAGRRIERAAAVATAAAIVAAGLDQALVAVLVVHVVVRAWLAARREATTRR